MAPQWMPQNIQKRLLKYILQQLSLFSEIDLPNLDVSLGASSKVNLRNLELDIEKFSIPGMYMRSGSIETLALSLTISDGVNVDCAGVNITLTPSLTPGKPNSTDQFSLAKSTADLANSVMFEDNVVEDEDIKETASVDSNPLPTESKDYKMSNMMAKAADMALSRLQLTVRDVKITMILEASVMEVCIDKVTLLSKEGTRYITVEGMTLNAIKPEVYPGEGVDNVDNSEERDTNESEGSEDYDDELMQTSFMAENKDDIHKSLVESMMFASQTSESVYMSATSNVFSSTTPRASTYEPPQPSAVCVAYVSKCSFQFDGLQNIENVQVDVGHLKIAVSPIPECLSSVIQSIRNLVRLSAMSTNETAGNTEKESESASTTLLNTLKIDEICVSFESALSKDGRFALDNSTCLSLSAIRFEQKNASFSFGSIAKIRLSRNDSGTELFCFDDSRAPNVADLGLEILSNDVSRITLICPKSANIVVDDQLLTLAVRYYSLMEPVIEAFISVVSMKTPYSYSNTHTSRFALPDTANNQKSNEFHAQMSSIHVKLQLNDFCITTTILPVTYDSQEGRFDTSSILFEYNDATLGGQYAPNQFLMISNFETSSAGVNKVRSFDSSSLQEIWLKTKMKTIVEKVTLKLDFDVLIKLISGFGKLADLVCKSMVISSPVARQKKVRMGSSLFLNATKVLKNCVEIKHCTMTFSHICPHFGDLKISLKDIFVNFLQDGTLHSYVMSALIQRVCDSIHESLLEAADPRNKGYPMMFAKFKDNVGVHFKNCSFNYYGEWITLLESRERPREEADRSSSASSATGKKRQVNFTFADVSIGLVPVNLKSKIEVVIKKGIADLLIGTDGRSKLQSSFSSLTLLLIDDVANILSDKESKSLRHWINANNNHAIWTLNAILKSKGFVPVGYISSLFLNSTFESERHLEERMTQAFSGQKIFPLIDTKIHVDALAVDLCADSSQCLIQTLKDLKQPVQFSFNEKYKPMTDEVDVFKDVDETIFSASVNVDVGNLEQTEIPENEKLEIVEDFFDKNLNSDSGEQSATRSGSLANSGTKSGAMSNIIFDDNHFGHSGEEFTTKVIPMAIGVSISNVTIKLYDGYDWKETQTTIKTAIRRVEDKAAKIGENMNEVTEGSTSQNVRSVSDDSTELDPEAVNEILYESIHVGLLAGQDPQSFYDNINKSISNSGDTENVSERNNLSPGSSSPASVNTANSTRSAAPSHNIELGKVSNRRVRLKRSIYHKVLVELENLDLSILTIVNNEPHPTKNSIVFSEDENKDDSELVSRIDLSVGSFKVADNVPTSSWNMFVGYLREAGDKELGSSMLHAVIDTVRPVSSLAASELVISVSVLPLRLYVDQDTLDFLTRFGEFKDDRFTLPALDEEEVFIEKFQVNSVRIKLDYKPKKVDYAGIRSGHTNEFMNFFILDESEMVLKKLVLYGIPGFTRLHKMLNDLWMPDIKRNQLGGVLSGLAPVKSIVKIGSGFRELVAVPLKEYEKDGRVIRGLQKGALSFAKITGGELLKFGVKLAAGTQNILESTEEALGGDGSAVRLPGYKKNQKSRRRTSPSEVIYATPGDRSLLGHNTMSGAVFHRNSFDSYGEEEEFLEGASALDGAGTQDADQYQKSRFLVPAVFKSTAELPDVLESDSDLDDYYDESDNEGQKIVSLYSNQPENLNEGLQTAYTSLGRNLDTAREAIVSASTRAARSGSAQIAAREFAKATPIMVIRPIIGTTEAISRTLQGGINILDPEEKRRSEEKYKNTKKEAS
ncbi:hypothetical protein KL938_001338 [Ogataea parapolymorpha]|nr:hypothetical protein KL938_001338 [Ogataea parapolymorpha]